MATADATAGRSARPKKRRYGRSERRLATWMIAPALVVMAVVAAYPIGYAVWLSLNEYSVRTPGLSRWAGFKNYSTALSDPEFWSAFWTTFAFTAISVTLELILGLAMAMAMHSAFKGRSVLRAVVLIPWATITAVTAITWRSIFEPDLGFAPQVLAWFGLAENVTWLGEKPYAFLVLVFADVWKTAPFMALLLLAGLQVISEDVYEAAKVDGATAWQRFMKITIPLLKPAILVALLFRTLDALRIFDLPAVLTQGANGTDTLSLHAYQELTQNRLIGLGSALSVITFVVVMTVSFLYIRFLGGNIKQLAEE